MIDPGKYTIRELKQVLKEEEISLQLIGRLRCDSRKGVQKLARKLINKRRKRQELEARWKDMNHREQTLRKQKKHYIAGLDEAGRGPLAGPVCAAAVILNPEQKILGLDDSKSLSAKKREDLFTAIKQKALDYSWALVENDEIDRLNIHQASIMAMKKAVNSLKQLPDYLLIDGQSKITDFDIEQETVVDGDGRCNAIAAASIVAKVVRDRIIEDYHQQYPQYNFKNNKGYGTAEHIAALKKHGPCSLHRNSFSPVEKYSN